MLGGVIDSARKLTLAVTVAFALGMALAPLVIKLAKKLYKLQSVGVHIGSQKIYTHIKCVTYNKYKSKPYCSKNSAAQHTAHFVEHICNNSCCKAKRQKS